MPLILTGSLLEELEIQNWGNPANLSDSVEKRPLKWIWWPTEPELLLLQHRSTAVKGRASVSATWHMHTVKFQILRRPMSFIFMPYRQQRIQVMRDCFTLTMNTFMSVLFTSSE